MKLQSLLQLRQEAFLVELMLEGGGGDDCIFKRVECGQFKEEKGNDYTVNVFDVPGHTVGFPITVSFVRPTTCA